VVTVLTTCCDVKKLRFVPTRCIDMFRLIPTIHAHYISRQRKLVGVCRDGGILREELTSRMEPRGAGVFSGLTDFDTFLYLLFRTSFKPR